MATQRELDHVYRMRLIQFWQDLGRRASYVLCVFLVCGAIYLSCRQLAGRITFADIGFKFLADLKADRSIALLISWILTGTTTAWGYTERRLRRRYIKKNHPVIKRYQESIDAKRGTSGLTTIGTTKEEDL
jgi:hypothetical protein